MSSSSTIFRGLLRTRRLASTNFTQLKLTSYHPVPTLTSTPTSTTISRTLCTTETKTETKTEQWPEHEFASVANHSLEAISDAVVDAPGAPDDFDADLSQGVLTIHVGAEHGTFVLNTQTPNRQLWLSSPVSGPFRYAWSPALTDWISTRDAHKLSEKLTVELSNVLNSTIRISFH